MSLFERVIRLDNMTAFPPVDAGRVLYVESLSVLVGTRRIT